MQAVTFDKVRLKVPGSLQQNESGSGQPHSKTLARLPEPTAIPQGFGVRLSSAAFSSYRPELTDSFNRTPFGNFNPEFPPRPISLKE
jgi:hypothetical protein